MLMHGTLMQGTPFWGGCLMGVALLQDHNGITTVAFCQRWVHTVALVQDHSGMTTVAVCPRCVRKVETNGAAAI